MKSIERESSGQHTLWADVYRVMRCPGPPCQLGPYCWRDPEGKKHYRLYPHHLRELIRFVQEGNRLESQADIPESIQRELKAADRLNAERKQTKATTTPLGMTPITINTHCPEHSQREAPIAFQSDPGNSIKMSPTLLVGTSLGIPGPIDAAVKDYSEWLKLFVQDASFYDQVDKARDVVLTNGLDLDQLHSDQEYKFLIDWGVNQGTARRFIGNIATWAARFCCDYSQQS